jgi:hypothetical protein
VELSPENVVPYLPQSLVSAREEFRQDVVTVTAKLIRKEERFQWTENESSLE